MHKNTNRIHNDEAIHVATATGQRRVVEKSLDFLVSKHTAHWLYVSPVDL